jgi:hypothetical protein
LKNQSSLLFLQRNLVQQSLLLDSVALKFLSAASVLLNFVLADSTLNFGLVLLSDAELLFFFVTVLFYLAVTVIIDLVEQVDSGFLPLLPLLLLFLLSLKSFLFDKSVEISLVGHHILIFIFDAGKGTLGLFSFFLFHHQLILGQLSFFTDDTFDHPPIGFFFLPKLYLFFLLDFLIFVVDGLKGISLAFDSLAFFEFCQFALPFPLFSQHLFLLDGENLLIFFFFLLPLLLDS